MRFLYRPNHPLANSNGLVDAQYAEPIGVDPHVHIISDTMAPTRHMANGKTYDSKAAFRAATKAAGCVEMGNDSSLTKPRQRISLSREKRRDDIRRAVHDLTNGRR